MKNTTIIGTIGLVILAALGFFGFAPKLNQPKTIDLNRVSLPAIRTVTVTGNVKLESNGQPVEGAQVTCLTIANEKRAWHVFKASSPTDAQGNYSCQVQGEFETIYATAQKNDLWCDVLIDATDQRRNDFIANTIDISPDSNGNSHLTAKLEGRSLLAGARTVVLERQFPGPAQIVASQPVNDENFPAEVTFNAIAPGYYQAKLQTNNGQIVDTGAFAVGDNDKANVVFLPQYRLIKDKNASVSSLKDAGYNGVIEIDRAPNAYRGNGFPAFKTEHMDIFPSIDVGMKDIGGQLLMKDTSQARIEHWEKQVRSFQEGLGYRPSGYFLDWDEMYKRCCKKLTAQQLAVGLRDAVIAIRTASNDPDIPVIVWGDMLDPSGNIDDRIKNKNGLEGLENDNPWKVFLADPTLRNNIVLLNWDNKIGGFPLWGYLGVRQIAAMSPFTKDAHSKTDLLFQYYGTNIIPLKWYPSAVADVIRTHDQLGRNYNVSRWYPDARAIINATGADPDGNLLGVAFITWHDDGGGYGNYGDWMRQARQAMPRRP